VAKRAATNEALSRIQDVLQLSKHSYATIIPRKFVTNNSDCTAVYATAADIV